MGEDSHPTSRYRLPIAISRERLSSTDHAGLLLHTLEFFVKILRTVRLVILVLVIMVSARLLTMKTGFVWKTAATKLSTTLPKVISSFCPAPGLDSLLEFRFAPLRMPRISCHVAVPLFQAQSAWDLLSQPTPGNMVSMYLILCTQDVLL